jgi:lipid-A-disaccharide synthase
MLVAGEASGDLLAAELVGALRERVLRSESDQTADVQPLRTELSPQFFGAGGPRMKAAGMNLAFDMTRHAVIGVGDPVKSSRVFLKRLIDLRRLAIQKQPDAIILVDFSFFNHLFARILRWQLRRRGGPFNNWNPKIVKFVSPQVWASRPGRAYQMARDFDLLLSIFPFEKDWYARRVPKLRVEFVGHPMVEWHSNAERGTRNAEQKPPSIVLLPGSRADEVRRHLPVVTGAFQLMRKEIPTIRGKMILPTDGLADAAKSFGPSAGLEILAGEMKDALSRADLALSKSGTITMECAMLGVPAVVFYKTTWPTYLIAKQIVSVPYLAMPNLLAGEQIFPEFVQRAATAENIAHAALELLRDEARRQAVKAKLEKVVASLGGPGANARAADAIISLLK